VTLYVGDILVNRYRIVNLVGQGGFGAVYRAWDLSLKVPVAVKENLDTSPEAQRQFEHEAQLLAPLRHANLPRVSDHFFIPDQGQYLVMDFVDGKSLEVLLAERGGPLGEAEALGWIVQVCDALEYLHTRTPPIIHRDIKPQNIIVAADGRAMLVDFGISKAYDPTLKTTRGARAVTPGFSPPEQYGTGTTDARSDVYALGSTLYTLLTGQPPPESVALIAGGETVIPIRRLNPGVNPATEAAVAAAMALASSQRLVGAGALREALAGRAIAPLSGVAPTVAVGSPAGGRRGVPAWLWAVVGLAAVVLIASGVYLLRDRDGVATPEPTTAAVAQATAKAEATVAEATEVTATETAVTTPPAATPSPAGNEYTVQPGDTLGAIAASVGVTVEELVAFNNLSDPDQLETGTVLRLPAAGGSLSPVATATPANRRVISQLEGGDIRQVLVPAGSFLMGADDEDSDTDEAPIHEVRLDAFWIDEHEVTNEQFGGFVAATGYVTTDELDGVGDTVLTSGFERVSGANWQHPQGPGSDLTGRAFQPVTLVSWDDARAYCAWIDGRLPTEAEWEYAARGPDALTFPWGNTFSDQRVNFCDRNCPLSWADDDANDGYRFMANVFEFGTGVSWVGAQNMAGNVWEWTADWYDEFYYNESPSDNPQGPPSVREGGKTVRGGAWSSEAQGVRSAVRVSVAPENGHFDVGFRCVADDVPVSTALPSAAPASAPASSPSPVAGATRVAADPSGDDNTSVYVPAGSFGMGSEDGNNDERPPHNVTLDEFWLDQTEVSNVRFAAFVADTGYQTAAEAQGWGYIFDGGNWDVANGANWQHPQGPGSDISGMDDYPVVQISRDDAAAFCDWAGGRLPTEAEWEYAARGPENRLWAWGNEFLPDRVNYCDHDCSASWVDLDVDDGYTYTAPVMSYPNGASWVGALNMTGNVWEWVADWYADDYYGRSPTANPPGPESGERGILRGGSWVFEARRNRTTDRNSTDPSYAINDFGIRCAYDADGSGPNE